MAQGLTQRELSISSASTMYAFRAACLRIAFLTCCAPLLLHSQTAIDKVLTPQATPASTAQAALPVASPSPTPVQAIPLPDIANQAEKLDELLRNVSKRLEPVLEMRVSDPEGKVHAAEVAQRARQTEDLLSGIPNVMQLQDEDRYWRALAEQYGSQRKSLTTRAADIEQAMHLLDTEQARWQATSEEVRTKPGLEVVAQRVQRELDSIRKTRSNAQAQLNLILTLQNRISEQDREVSAVLRKLEEAHARMRGKLFERDSYPLWAARELRAYDQSITTAIYVSAGRGFTGTRNFLAGNESYMLGMAAIYIVALLIAFRLKQHLAAGGEPSEIADGSRIFTRPFSVALLVTLLTTVGITASAPTGVSFVVCLLYVIPVLRLLTLLVKPGMRKVLYVLSAFYFLQWAHLVLQLRPVFKREMFALIIFLALIIFVWLTLPSKLRVRTVPRWRGKLLVAGLRMGLFLLAASVLANVLGFVSLSQIIGVGTLFSAFTLALLYTMVRVLDMGLTIALSSTWFQSLPEGHGDVIGRWGRRLLVICAALLWINVDLYLFTVRGTVMDTLEGVLQYPIGWGKFHITLGGTLGLILFLLLGYVIANTASFILGNILLPKLSLKGGMAYAISRVTYYVLLVGLFFAAMANAGLELNKFTLVTGALGLGVGFGLQNIVNNFASGLIILFERPIRLGDTVEVNGVAGTVRRIGARSSTVVTPQGAEVILPNSNLLSNQVINWTLSSPRRRVEIQVGIPYGADPELVTKLLTELASSNPRVLPHPQPQTFFLGFGESALNFELTFWAAQHVWFELKSEIGLAVLRALRDAGIEIPYPQRDLHVRSMDSLEKAMRSAPADCQTFKNIAAGR